MGGTLKGFERNGILFKRELWSPSSIHDVAQREGRNIASEANNQAQ